MSQNVIEVKVKPNSHEFSVEKKDLGSTAMSNTITENPLSTRVDTK